MKSISPPSILAYMGHSGRIFQNNLGKLVAAEWANTLEHTRGGRHDSNQDARFSQRP